MTLPNCARSPKCVAKAMKATAVVQQKLPVRHAQSETVIKSENLQQELQMLLSSLSPAHDESASPQLMPNKAETMTSVELSRKRLFEDVAFQANESFQRMLLCANNPVVQVQPGSVDPFAAAMKKMPTNTHSYQEFGTNSDDFSPRDSSRSQCMEAVALQNMVDAVEQVDDPTLKACYEQTAHDLHAWGERRMVQQQPQPQSTNMERGGNLLSMSLSEVSPYALELAARTSLPHKRSSLTKLSKKLMNEWFEHNLHHPYPTEEEKEWLSREGGITLNQVNNWFINTRGRKWKPMLKRLMSEKQAGNCELYDKMVQKIEEPYQSKTQHEW